MHRQLVGKWRWVARGVAIAFSLFQIYTAGFGLLPDMQQRAIHVLLGFTLALLLLPPTKRAQPENRVPIRDVVLIGLVIASSINAYVKYEWFYLHVGESTTLDIFLAIVIIIMALEVGRRVTGWVFPILTSVALLYAFLGPHIPGLFGHGGFSLLTVIQQLYQTTLGVWGFVTGISATILAIFLIFGTFLLFTGGGQTFMDLALKLAGRFRGGPALVAIAASSMFGTISGSAVVNVATTGNFTIPLMKRLGYKPEFAGGVEAAASSGGQITPPIMGAGAFIMAEMLGIPYLKVVVAAIIPAYLFYVAIFAGVRFESLRLNLSAVPANEIPKTRQLLTWGRLGPLFVPIAALLGFLLTGYSPTTAGFWAIFSAIVIFLFSNLSLSQMKQRVRVIIGGLERAGVALIEIVALSVNAGIIVSLISLTGVGVKLSEVIVTLAGGVQLVGLIMAAVVALILGMGMVTTAAYLIAAAVVGPALSALGIAPLAGHLFIFYFAIISGLTPPVCTPAFVAATIAGTSWVKVAIVALRLAIVAYFIPFIFVYKPALLMSGEPLEIALAVVLATLGALFLGAGIMGYFTARLSLIPRLLIILGAALLLFPGWQTGLVGIAVIGLTLLGNTLVRPVLLR